MYQEVLVDFAYEEKKHEERLFQNRARIQYYEYALQNQKKDSF